MFSTLKKWFIGRPLKSGAEAEGGLLGKMQALAMLSSDALSSIAYGPEQVVLVLMTVSAGAIWWSLPIGVVVLILLASLTISYRQVIHAYPQGGGAYMVTSENLSPKAGLIAGGSLLVRCRCHYLSHSSLASIQPSYFHPVSLDLDADEPAGSS